MKKITAYETIDGQVFPDEHEARQHESKVILSKSLEKLVDDHCYSGMDRGDILSFLLEHRDELVSIIEIYRGSTDVQ